MDVSLQVGLSITTLTIFLLHLSGLVIGSVTISPEIASVCRGHQLDLICSITGTHLQWSFSLIPEGRTTARVYTFTLTSLNQVNQLQLFIVNSTMFTFSRISAANSMPLVSSLMINATSDRLNGTRVTCLDVEASDHNASESTTIHVINENLIIKAAGLEITLVSEQFEKDGVIVTLEWTKENNPLQDLYNISVSPHLEVMFTERDRVQLIVPYNKFHNVSIISTATPYCQQNSVTSYVGTTLYYTKCRDLADAANGGIIIFEGHNDLANEGSNITFGCSSEFVPYTSTCMANGEWEPDPENFKLNCSDVMTTIMVMITSSDAESFNYGIMLGSVLGAIMLMLLTVASIIVISVRFAKAKFKHSDSNNVRQIDDHERYTYMRNSRITINAEVNSCPVHDDRDQKIATSNLMYAEIGLSSSNQHTISTINLDDDVVEYAKLNHSLLSPTVMSQKSQHADFPCVSLDNLLIQLRPQITPKWYQFGEAAGIEKGVLDDCAKTCSPEDCTVEMLDYWLRNSVHQPTWKDIGEILRAIGLLQLAFDIERVYTTGKLPVEVDMDRIPQLQESVTSEPPPILPKMLDSATLILTDQEMDHYDQNLPNIKAVMPTPLAPSLPPKPSDRSGWTQTPQ